MTGWLWMQQNSSSNRLRLLVSMYMMTALLPTSWYRPQS